MPKPLLFSRLGSAVLSLLMAHTSAFAAFADDLAARFPATRGATIEPAWPGFYSVVRGEEVVFVKDDLSILINGDVLDLTSGTSLSKRLRDANKKPVDLSLFNPADAITFGSGPSTIYVMSDPDCPYCKQLEHELEGLKGVKVLLFPFPLTSLHPQAALISERIWCSGDRAAAWKDYVLRGILPAARSCANPISRNLSLGAQLGVQGTPAIFFQDGTLVPGAVPLARIRAQIEASNFQQSKAAK